MDSNGTVTIGDTAQVVFQDNHAEIFGGATTSNQDVTIAGSVKFINNSANQGGAIGVYSGSVTIADNAEVGFQDNHAETFGGAIASFEHVTIAGSVQFMNNSANQGGAIGSTGAVTIADNAKVGFQDNHATTPGGGAVASFQHLTIAGSV